ncbi:hypothetical protein [Sinosporangium album]|nr:hypothetical protein [Sinosporangium album]
MGTFDNEPLPMGCAACGTAPYAHGVGDDGHNYEAPSAGLMAARLRERYQQHGLIPFPRYDTAPKPVLVPAPRPAADELVVEPAPVAPVATAAALTEEAVPTSADAEQSRRDERPVELPTRAPATTTRPCLSRPPATVPYQRPRRYAKKVRVRTGPYGKWTPQAASPTKMVTTPTISPSTPHLISRAPALRDSRAGGGTGTALTPGSPAPPPSATNRQPIEQAVAA